MTTKLLYEFPIDLPSEVDETVSRQEGDKTITETVKVKKLVHHSFAFQRPSRAQRELADEEYAIWWTRYVEKGIMPEAQLRKTYSNLGGTWSEDEKKEYDGLVAARITVEREVYEVRSTDKDNKARLDELTVQWTKLSNAIIDFRQSHDVFFNQTAEAKARIKLIDYLRVHFALYRTDETKDWQPLFVGSTTEERLNTLEAMVERADPLLAGENKLTFIASIYATAANPAALTREDIDRFEREMAAPQ